MWEEDHLALLMFADVKGEPARASWLRRSEVQQTWASPPTSEFPSDYTSSRVDVNGRIVNPYGEPRGPLAESAAQAVELIHKRATD